jgi:hypothetical protein
MVYHEDDKIYYVDKMPFSVNKENFVPYELNNQIGVALKSDIEEACNFFLRCYTLEVNEQELKKTASFRSDIVGFIHVIADNYSAAIEQVDGYSRCYGATALEKLIEFCDAGVDLKKYFLTQNWSLQDRISFDIWMIHSSRQLLHEFLKLERTNLSLEQRQEKNLIMQTLFESIVPWKSLQSILTKLVVSGSTLLNSKIGNRVRKLMEVESRLNALLKNFS